MSNTKKYNIFIFLSTFIRNILEVYSIVYLYKKGLGYRNILSFYILLYILTLQYVNFSYAYETDKESDGVRPKR